MEGQALFAEIKAAVESIVPDARILIYGSYARNEQHEESDVDIMIIVNKKNLTRQERKEICYAVYDVEIKNFIMMSPRVMTSDEWNEKKDSTPFYENVLAEGIEI